MSKNKAIQQITLQKDINKQPAFTYEVGSNVVMIDEKQIYLSKILWNENLTYDDIKEYIVE